MGTNIKMGFLWFLFLFFISKVIFNTTDLPLPPTSNKIKGFPLPNRLLTFTFQFSVFKFLSLREKEAIFHPESISESKKKKDFSLSLSLSLSVLVKKQQSLNPRRRRRRKKDFSLCLCVKEQQSALDSSARSNSIKNGNPLLGFHSTAISLCNFFFPLNLPNFMYLGF